MKELTMKKREIGKGGRTVGAIGLGAMSFAGAFGPTDEATSFRAMDKAMERGINHIDTALIYGPYTSEEILGRYLVKNPSARRQLHIATKGGIRPEPRGIVNEAAFLRECLEGSLKRLGVDHIDLYYIHRRDQTVPIEDVMETLAAFKREGKIGGIGFSEISPPSLERAVEIAPVMAVQSEYSLWTRLPQLGMAEACARHGAALVAYSPLARGVLSDVVLDPATFPDRDFRKPMPRFQPDNYHRNMAVIERFKTFARERGWRPASLALAWLLHKGPHIIPIPGTRTAEHVEEIAAGADIHLSTDDLAAIDAIMPNGWAHGHRYADQQQVGVEQYC
jgi:aryl-alcohol dehydrogenase-like predicted oxidoreductase